MPEDPKPQDAKPQDSPYKTDDWRQLFPEDVRGNFKSLDDARNWTQNINKQVGALNNDLGDLKKQVADAQRYQQTANEWSSWWGNLAKSAPSVAAALREADKYGEYEKWWGERGKPAPQPAPHQAQDGKNPFEGWADLDPSEQAQRLAAHTSAQLQQEFTKWQDGFKGFLTEREKFYEGRLNEQQSFFQNYLRIYQEVMDAKGKDPDLDVDAAMKQALAIAQGTEDPLKLGMRLSTLERDTSKKIEAAKKLWEAEATAKADKAKETAPPIMTTPPSYRPQSSPGGGAAARKDAIAQKLVEKYGTGIF